MVNLWLIFDNRKHWKGDEMKLLNYCLILLLAILMSCTGKKEDSGKHWPDKLFEYSDHLEPRWSSFENITAEKGKGGIENHG